MYVFIIKYSAINDNFNVKDELAADLALLRSMPGVINAAPIRSMPLMNGGSNTSFSLVNEPNPDISIPAAYYQSDEAMLETFGFKLIEGEPFRAEDIYYRDPSMEFQTDKIIVSKAFAQDAFGEQESYLGKIVYMNTDNPQTIVGVVDIMQSPWEGWGKTYNAIMLPQVELNSYQRIAVRAEPGMRDNLMKSATAAIKERNPDRLIRQTEAFIESREYSYRNDAAMTKVLTLIVVILFIITSLGIVGLASFTVNRRKKQIGTRRALGARKSDIIRYFMTENWMITSMGLCLGVVLTFGLNQWLIETYSMPRLDWYYVPAGMLIIWLLGLLAVYMPARRAASISPAIATRSA